VVVFTFVATRVTAGGTMPQPRDGAIFARADRATGM
jgi:hypothetical protein